MVNDLIKNKKLSDMLYKHAVSLIDFLISSDIEFGIVCDTSEIIFEPQLPPEIMNTIKPIALFVLSGYSFETAFVSECGMLQFEAGFGHDNFGSMVSTPMDHIIQIVVGDTPIFINITAGQNKKLSSANQSTLENSIRCFMDNPENKKFFSK